MYYTYPAIVHKSEDGSFWAEFVDFHAFSQGATLDELIGNAEEAMTCHIEDELKNGSILPVPSDIRQIRISGDDFATLVHAPATAPEPQHNLQPSMSFAVS